MELFHTAEISALQQLCCIKLKLDKSQKYILKCNIKYTILKSSFSTFESKEEILQ